MVTMMTGLSYRPLHRRRHRSATSARQASVSTSPTSSSSHSSSSYSRHSQPVNYDLTSPVTYSVPIIRLRRPYWTKSLQNVQKDNGMSEEDHYDTPWEFLARPTSVRLSSADIRYSISPKNRDNLTKSPSITSQLAHINNSPPIDDPKRHSLRERVTKIEHHHPLHQQQQHYRRRDGEDYILEKNVDRVEAEKRLEARATGDFLLRLRGEDSAALSLRGSAGILHIKLERRGEKWIIGDGPCFRSITSAINYYQRHPLPIRGADHLLLRQPVSSVIRF
ncbi:unnamed protein product [Auanema sp. JU1783]|nr:unnamed protein product [Auanema sp. JU1783]